MMNLAGPERLAASIRPVLDWARDAAIPLAPAAGAAEEQAFSRIGSLIGSASLVALGEAAHLAAEPLMLRNGLLDYLVREKGFTAIAIESGIAESWAIFDFVRGGPGDLGTVTRDGLSWGFGDLPQNRALIAWLRDYNERCGPARKINFYGFDVPGSPGVTDASRGLEDPFVLMRAALEHLDSEAACQFAKGSAPIVCKLAELRFSEMGVPEGPLLSADEHDALTASIDDCVSRVERAPRWQEGCADSFVVHQWRLRIARSLQQLDRWLRTVCGQDGGPTAHALPAILAQEQRDRAQADNLEWIVEREGNEGKVLIFAHRHHLSSCPVTRQNKRDASSSFVHQVAGTFLRARQGSRLVTIAQVAGGGSVSAAGAEVPFAAPQIPSFEALLSRVGIPDFVLDLREAPFGIDALLPLVTEGGGFRTLTPALGFDLLLYTGQLTPALPARAHHEERASLTWN